MVTTSPACSPQIVEREKFAEKLEAGTPWILETMSISFTCMKKLTT
ncbi:hypothetical protein [Bacillus toyonensis]|nr:hypothetical protein [Bacillus toyonensis]